MKDKEYLSLATLGAFAFGAVTMGGMVYFLTRGASNNFEDSLSSKIKVKKPPPVSQTPSITLNDVEQQLIRYEEAASSSTFNLNINNATVNVSALYQLVDHAVRDRVGPLEEKQKELQLQNEQLSKELKLSKFIIRKLIKQMADMKIEQADTAVNLVDLTSVILGEALSYKEKEEMILEFTNKNLTKFINLFTVDEREHLSEETISYLENIRDSEHKFECLGELSKDFQDETLS